MEFKGNVYAKMNGRYIRCTETIEDLEDKITALEKQVKNLTIPFVRQQSELFVSFARFTNNYGKGSYATAYEDMFKEWCKKRNI